MKRLLTYICWRTLAALLVVALACAPALAANGTPGTGENVEGPQPGPLPAQPEPPEPAAGTVAGATTVIAADAPRYSLTNIGQATTAKIQKPWGACWAFAVAGALESSILKAEATAQGQQQSQLSPESPAFAEPNLANLPTTPDVSERAIGWFAHQPQTEASAGTQAGEGFALTTSSPEEQLSGGNFATATSALTAWQSLVSEEAAPYEYNGYVAGESLAWYGDNPAFDARYEDWSLPDEVRLAEDTGWRVSEVLRLQSPAVRNSFGDEYARYDAQATAAIKRTLVNVGGVAVALSMEQNIPSDVWSGNHGDAEPSESFTFSTWSQYNADVALSQNHAAVILGWDDAYPAANFQGTSSGQPPADGAWLCKNSWGNDALYEALGGVNEATRWGLSDANGQASGYFWLSYYDHNIADLEAFAVTPVEASYDTLHQYDYVGAAEVVAPVKYSGPVQAANVFTAAETELLEAVTAWTFAPNTGCAVTVGVLPYGFDAAAATPDEVMAASVPAARAAAVFDEAGFHTLELDTPVLLVEGQQFTLTLEIGADEGGLDASAGQLAADAHSYLGVEVAYLDPGAQTTSATAVENAGETFVRVDGAQWQAVESLSDDRATLRKEIGREPDFTYGNALVKGLANTTTMADPAHVYRVVPLHEQVK